MRHAIVALHLLLGGTCACAQVPPSAAEVAAYRGLHGAAAQGDATRIAALLRAGDSPNERDKHGRTPLQHADETPVPMLDPKAKTGRTQRAYRWSYCTTQFNPLKAVVFDFATAAAGTMCASSWA